MTPEQVDTPTAILESAAELLRECTFDDIAYRALGERVGVSERTIYRQFPTRSHLLTALARHLETTTLAMPGFDSVTEFQRAVRAYFRALDLAPAYAYVVARATTISPVDAADPSQLTTDIRAMIAHEAPGLNSRDASRVATSLRYFASAVLWARLRSGFDMDAGEIADVFDEAVTRIVGRLPRTAWSTPR